MGVAIGICAVGGAFVLWSRKRDDALPTWMPAATFAVAVLLIGLLVHFGLRPLLYGPAVAAASPVSAQEEKLARDVINDLAAGRFKEVAARLSPENRADATIDDFKKAKDLLAGRGDVSSIWLVSDQAIDGDERHRMLVYLVPFGSYRPSVGLGLYRTEEGPVLTAFAVYTASDTAAALSLMATPAP